MSDADDCAIHVLVESADGEVCDLCDVDAALTCDTCEEPCCNDCDEKHYRDAHECRAGKNCRNINCGDHPDADVLEETT